MCLYDSTELNWIQCEQEEFHYIEDMKITFISVRDREEKRIKKTPQNQAKHSQKSLRGFPVFNWMHFFPWWNTGILLKQTRWNTSVVAARNSAPKQEM